MVEPLLDKRLPYLMRYARQKLPKATLVIFSNEILLNIKLYRTLVKNGVNAFVITKHTKKMPTAFEEVLRYNHNHDPSVTIVFQEFKDDSPMMNRGGLFEITKAINVKKNCGLPQIQLFQRALHNRVRSILITSSTPCFVSNIPCQSITLQEQGTYDIVLRD